ncbi:MAG: hypothetical protein EOS03_05070 [Mesorhizobium sp.]|uniref:hypothetical protein n=1 Tax=Mesorhizobium sp. TaxID=1871066 RepID=UPI000FE4C7ED|nr:hypothetical protein [Mesorhizobium sp.]RWN49814.1 MAG: hypothetical protein EOS03_05070 [Mesorhizobium sp.]
MDGKDALPYFAAFEALTGTRGLSRQSAKPRLNNKMAQEPDLAGERQLQSRCSSPAASPELRVDRRGIERHARRGGRPHPVKIRNQCRTCYASFVLGVSNSHL